ncbi:MAG: hypothetical protein ACRC62_11195 [Microcoleus sp.]
MNSLVCIKDSREEGRNNQASVMIEKSKHIYAINSQLKRAGTLGT